MFQLGFLIPYFMTASFRMTAFIVSSIERTAVETTKTSAEQLIHIAHGEQPVRHPPVGFRHVTGEIHITTHSKMPVFLVASGSFHITSPRFASIRSTESLMV